MPKQYKTGDAQSAVYALADPRDLAVRYVGVTSNVKRRLSSHRHPSPKTFVAPKLRAWIAELAAAGVLPVMVVLERISHDERPARENQWLYFGRSLGWDLLNETGPGAWEEIPAVAS